MRIALHVYCVLMAILCVLCYWKRSIANWFYYCEILANVLSSSYAHTVGYN